MVLVAALVSGTLVTMARSARARENPAERRPRVAYAIVGPSAGENPRTLYRLTVGSFLVGMAVIVYVNPTNDSVFTGMVLVVAFVSSTFWKMARAAKDRESPSERRARRRRR